MKPSEAIKFSRPLWPHQAEDLDRFAGEPEVALFWRMGTGKTTEAIGLLRAQYQAAGAVLPTLIISPVATLENWQEEFMRNAPGTVSCNTAIAYGKKSSRIAVIEDEQIIITNPESLDMKEVAVALGNRNFHSIVVDEVHRFKDPKSKRLKTLLGLTGRAKHKIIMTGTPILNSYLDLWAQFMILDGGKTFGNNFFVFRAKYFRDKNAGWASKPGYFPDWVPKPGIEAEISRLIDAKSSRRHEDDVLKLPPRIFKKAYVEMGKEQAKVYRQMEEQLVAEIEAGTCAATNALSQVTRLLQILAGYLPLPEMQSTGFFDDNPRLERLHELLRELSPQNKIIVWACFTPEYQLIESKLKYLGIEFAELTGRIQEKQAEIERFRNDPKCRVMIANAKAGGVGVNLVEAAYSIYYSRGYSLGDYEQSAARNRRGGSEIHSSVVQIDLVVKNTLDEEVLDALQRKENFASTVLDRLKRK